DDGFAPSCYSCHDRIWAGEGPPTDHTENRMGFADHQPGLGNPIENDCGQCHGPNLDDGFAPSCYTCHDRIWAGEGPPADHTENRMGFADHQPGLGNPVENDCGQCHGPNLDDGFAPSCYTCHDRIWAGGGPPADHTENRMGFADHQPGLGNPIDNDCGQCHGPNLDDGFAPSCYTCHNRIWAGEGPPADHTDVRGGFAAHQPGLEAPIDNNCTQCHGPNLHEGFAPSCFTCHVGLWGGGGGENQPPSVDTGGPYSGSVDYSVGFDASATFDPDNDMLTFGWDFGDGSPLESSGRNPATIHTYATAGIYTGTLSVDDGVNPPVFVDFVVDISDDPPPPQGDAWSVNLPLLSDEFTVTFEQFGDYLVVKTTRTGGGVSFGIGLELDGVIFWMNQAGELFFGNIDRNAGTMSGVMFGQGDSGSIWVAEKD
ncbi:MAG TPA: PKD domain-containing protein, partial [Thermoguttaceae bacterium]|nr:PKD domain-containing protein [Thermoguttaceae bacterium]